MSWKLAEWRWREQAPLRERSLWKIWDVNDLSAPPSRSISSIASLDSVPATPQLPTDFLDSRDWNHLAIDQKFERSTAVNQLGSSFGLFSETARRHRSTSFLIPKTDIRRFALGKLDADENKMAKDKRKDTPPAKVFEDLESAHSGIVGQSGREIGPSSRVMVRNSMSFFDLDREYRKDIAVPAPAPPGIIRQAPTAGHPPETALPPLPARLNLRQYNHVDLPSSEIADYDNTQNLLDAGQGTMEEDTNGKGKAKAVQEDVGDNTDWETVHGSSGFQSTFQSQENLQPLFEPHGRATDTTNTFQSQSLQQPLAFEPHNRATDTNDFSFADLSSSDLSSTHLSTRRPASPWDPLPMGMTRTHPALPGTPHKYRLRTDVGTAEQFLVPEYSLPEVGQRSSDSDPFHSAETKPDLPEGYPAQITQYSIPTPRQQALGEDTSSEQQHSSSPLVFSRRQLKTSMVAAIEEQDLVQGRVVHELEGDEVHYDSGVKNSAEGNNKAGIPEAESFYSLASVDIIQDKIGGFVKSGVQSPANAPGIGIAITTDSSDDISIRNGMRYGEQVGGIEMSNMGQAHDFSRNFSRGSAHIQPGSSELSLPFKQRLMSQGRSVSYEDLMKRLSTIDNDGSFYGDENDNEFAASLSSVIREQNPVNPRAGTFADPLHYTCPQFPLRDSDLNMKFVKGEGRREGTNICYRSGISRINGMVEEEAYCFLHQRREFSVTPSLRRIRLNAEALRLQKRAGREIVRRLLCVPLFGWVLLYYVWKQDPALMVSNDLMRWKTDNLIAEMGQKEVELAGRALVWCGLGFTGVAFGCLAVLLWAFL